ncbi:hypothetical protein WA026_019193 [Henosepilachna vigintioctopunctata]|uniref:Pcf11 C-terminal domain-containing protein n=1 Tax=Henosepilachna vigintioctopunctata TaxID=420089 RepID=A0AAW1V4Y2_9CUCU
MASEVVKGYVSMSRNPTLNSSSIDLIPKFPKNTVVSCQDIDLKLCGPPEKKTRIVYEFANRQKSICNKSRRLKRPADEDLRLNQASSTTYNTNKMRNEYFPKRFARENSGSMPYWRGVRGRTRWDAPPVIRSQARPWMQVPMPQRPMNNCAPPGNFRPQLPPKFQNFNSTTLSTNMVYSPDRVVNYSCYQVKNQTAMQQPGNIPNSSNMFNINDLFQKLIASGLLSTNSSLSTGESLPAFCRNRKSATVCNKQLKKTRPLELVSFSKPEQLKVRQAALYEKLYSGKQCSNCGMRFPPEQSMQYSQHLDWHFRQNHKRKTNKRFTYNRRWYYSLSDWQKYAGIENTEEKVEKCFFELQKEAKCAAKRSTETAALPSVRADPKLRGKSSCEVCGDKFEIFFNDDEEEWQFKNSIRFEDKFYHPICFEENQKSLQNAALKNSNMEHQENTGSNKEE